MEMTSYDDLLRNQLSNQRFIVAVFHNGSSVVDMNTTLSDIDFVIIVQRPEHITEAIASIQELFARVEVEKDTSMYTCAGFYGRDIKVDCSFFWKEQCDEYIRLFSSNIEEFQKLQHMIQHKVVDSLAVLDHKNLLFDYQSQVQKAISRYWKDTFYYSIRRAEETVKEWEQYGFRNEFQFGYMLWEMITLLVQALYMRNKKLFMLPFKRLHRELCTLHPDISSDMYSLLEGKNNDKTIKKKIKVIKDIITRLKSDM